MIHASPAVIRALALFIPLGIAAALLIARRPEQRRLTAAFLGTTWMLCAGLGLHEVARRFGFWNYDARGGIFDGLPVDLYLGWAVFWGALPILAVRRPRLLPVVAIFLWADLLLMPAAYPVVRLGHNWLIGEAFGLLIGLVPATLLARWTAADSHLGLRSLMQCIAFGTLSLVAMPAVVLTTLGTSVGFLTHGPGWAVGLALQLLALPAIVGLSAVQEFVTRGHGTPLPWDPPRTLVRTGAYAYLANPMQASMTVLTAGVGALLGSWPVAAAAAVALVFSIGLAAWQENGDLRARFGPAWAAYRREVRDWIPRWSPVRLDQPATLYFSATCFACSGLARWLEQRHVIDLTLAQAERLSERPRRLTYVGADGYHEQGVNALARALEHINVGFAFIGWTIRLPGISQIIQLFTDAVGGEPRELPAPLPTA
ncbi:MAG: isoprenylcysteine carboxylmethyltransferase family protein [Candidatus Dormibacteraeota bacterium]|nr:isoprenylcysteine carboxylmethyltransferase family protein [Candidatus Dormibacteraeota bacterium]